MKTILSLIVLFMVVNLNAQTRLMDLSVLPVNQINDTIEMLVKFKVKNISEVQSIQLFFETQPQLADIVQKSVTISQQGNIYFVTLDGKTTPVQNYSVLLYSKLDLQQFNSYRVTRVVVTFNNQTSESLMLNL